MTSEKQTTMSDEKEISKSDVEAVAVIRADSNSDMASAEDGTIPQQEGKKPMATKRALIAWLVLCFSVSF